MSRLLIAVLISVISIFAIQPSWTLADELVDYDVEAGHFFSQTNGTTLGAKGGGYVISNANGIPFWDFFQKQGGVDRLGYPVSQRFVWDGYVCQVTQRAILQWEPSSGTVQLANVFDYLSQTGKDDWLASAHLAPKARRTLDEVDATQPLSFVALAQIRFRWLHADPAILNRYFSTPNYYVVYGLPTSPVEDLGPYTAMRFQRAVLYHWKIEVPWADSQGISVGLAGDLFKELGGIPAEALRPQSADGKQPEALPSISSPSELSLTSAAPAAKMLAAPAKADAPINPSPISPSAMTGVGTWYGGEFQGRRMANGRPYNMHDPRLAASNTYPLGTMLRVTRLTTGQSIIVQVSDRGAFRYPNVIDLSYAAFAQLGDPAIGVMGVRVEPLGAEI